MSRRNWHIKNVGDTLNNINQGVEMLVETSDQVGKKMDGITEELVKGNRAKPLEIAGFVVAAIGVVATIIGVIVAIVGSKVSNGNATETASSDAADTAAVTAAYEIYLYPDYSRVEVGFKTDITATLNFDTDSVNIDAYLDSAHNGDTVTMKQKNSSEWQAKVYFEEAGTYEVIATAKAPDGSVIEGAVEIEVVP